MGLYPAPILRRTAAATEQYLEAFKPASHLPESARLGASPATAVIEP
jgi:hypothetical protein